MILLYVVDIFGKYSWVFLLKDKKGIITVNVFQSISTNSKKKKKQIKYGLFKVVNSVTILFKNGWKAMA